MEREREKAAENVPSVLESWVHDLIRSLLATSLIFILVHPF